MSLWTSTRPEGPFEFVAYVLDGAHDGSSWDSGRYSESRIWKHPTTGLFHAFASGSPKGAGGDGPNKIHEQIGWAVSANGINFTEYAANPVVAYVDSQPHTIALAEGHLWFDEPRGLYIVYHTVRWDRENAPPPIEPPYPPDPFAPRGRNAEDLGYSVLAPSSTFSFELPLITSSWRLDLTQSEPESKCVYNWDAYRYCSPIKVRISGTSPPSMPATAAANATAGKKLLTPDITFVVASTGARCDDSSGAPSVAVRVYAFGKLGVGKRLLELPVTMERCGNAGVGFRGTTTAQAIGRTLGETWLSANVLVTKGALPGVTLAARYESTAANVLETVEVS